MESLNALLSPGADFDELFDVPSSSRAPPAGVAAHPPPLPRTSSMFDAWLDEDFDIGSAGVLHADSGAARRAVAGGASAGAVDAGGAVGGGRAGAASQSFSDGTSFFFSMPQPAPTPSSEPPRATMTMPAEIDGGEIDGKDEDPGGSDVDDDDDDEDDGGAALERRGSASGGKNSREKQTRLERNRVSAKQSRLRKKQYLELLESRVATLSAELHRVRLSHAVGVNAALARERDALLERVEPLAHLSNPTEADSAVLEQASADLVNMFGPDSADLRKVRDFLFDALHRLLLSPHAKFFLWLATQPPDFFAPPRAADTTDASPSPSLWSLLCAEMYLTPEQSERLHKQLHLIMGSSAAAHETWRLGATAACIARLRAAVAATAATAHAQLVAVRGALTPAQFVKAEAWTTRNSARIARAAEEK